MLQFPEFCGVTVSVALGPISTVLSTVATGGTAFVHVVALMLKLPP